MKARTRLRRGRNGRPFQSYQILFLLENETSIRIGALGRCSFPAGLYIYTGSARKHIEARIRRHLAPSKCNRWHIDYLLSHPLARVVSTKRSSLEECVLNQRTRGRTIVRRLGASDCTQHCESHLKFIGKNRLRSATVQKRR
ncbi:MAG: GIY-YIG nuclease family protein [Bacteroidota bacterium]